MLEPRTNNDCVSSWELEFCNALKSDNLDMQASGSALIWELDKSNFPELFPQTPHGDIGTLTATGLRQLSTSVTNLLDEPIIPSNQASLQPILPEISSNLCSEDYIRNQLSDLTPPGNHKTQGSG
jgi:hypothetical protein